MGRLRLVGCLVSRISLVSLSFLVASLPAFGSGTPGTPRFVKTVTFKKATAEMAEKTDIERVVSWAKKQQSASGRVEGYACEEDIKGRSLEDEKTKLWILTMAERRATVVVEALAQKGIARDRLKIVPLGMAEAGEACKAQVVFLH